MTDNRDVISAFEHGALEARRTGDTAMTAVREMLDPDLVVRVFPDMPYGGVHVGAQAFIDLLQAVPRSRVTLKSADFRFVDLDSTHVAAEFSYVVKWLATGFVLRVGMFEIFTIVDGRIVGLSPYYSDSAAIAAATRGVRVVALPTSPTQPPVDFDSDAEVDSPAGDLARSWVARWWEVLDGAEPASALAEHLHPEVLLRAPQSIAGGGTYHGHDGVGTFLECSAAAWSPTGAPLDRVLDGGDGRVLLHSVTTLTSRDNGAECPVEVATMLEFRDGLISDVTPYFWDTVPLANGTVRP